MKKKKIITIDYEVPQAVKFKDKGMEEWVRVELRNLKTNEVYKGDLTPRMLEKVYAIVARGDDSARIPKINTLEDLYNLPNVSRLDIPYQNITDISPLLCKSTWSEINLLGANISDDSVFDQINVENSIGFPKYNIGGFISDSVNYKTYLNIYRQTKEKVNYFLTNYINDSMSDYEKYKTIHDYLVQNMEYDNDYITNAFENSLDSPLYLALVEGKGICSIYARAYESLCQECKLECITVTGEAEGITYEGDTPSWGYHDWNIINLNGKYYHVDVTWDDPIGRNSEYVKDEYFLLSDAEILSKRHKWD